MSGRNSVEAYLGLGGNVGDPRGAMSAALKALEAIPGTQVVTVSSLYRTPPWGRTDQPDFLNAAAGIRTVLAPRALMDACLGIERDLRRERRERWGPRLIDIDILVYGEREIDEDGLAIPHPRMLERAFVLVPLAEIAPRLIAAGAPVADHAAQLETSSIVALPGGRDWWKGVS